MLTVKQAAERMGVSPSLVYALARQGRIGHLRIGQRGRRGKLLFAERDVAAFIEECRREPPGGPDEEAYQRHLR